MINMTPILIGLALGFGAVLLWFVVTDTLALWDDVDELDDFSDL